MAQEDKKAKLAAEVWAKYRRSRRKLESTLTTPAESLPAESAPAEQPREYVPLPTLH